MGIRDGQLARDLAVRDVQQAAAALEVARLRLVEALRVAEVAGVSRKSMAHAAGVDVVTVRAWIGPPRTARR